MSSISLSCLFYVALAGIDFTIFKVELGGLKM